jgi:hypothetical protein
MTAGQVSDYTGAAELLDDLPKARWLLGDRGYDADWFKDTLQAKGIQPCIPSRKIYSPTRKLRQAPIQIPRPHRDHVRSREGLAPRWNPLRPARDGLLLGHRPRSYRHILPLTVSPDLAITCEMG